MTAAISGHEPIDLYWSFRSPYSYLALKGVNALARQRNVAFNVKIVHPLAIRDTDFFPTRGQAWLSYMLRDIFRLAQMTEQPLARPVPDPIVQNMETMEVADDQPYIHRLARLGVLAAEAGHGLAFITEASAAIWSGRDWTQPDGLAAASARAGLDLAELDAQAVAQADRLDAVLAENDVALRRAGHWGVPTCVMRGEPFFGMDRLDALAWRLDQLGIG